MEKEMTGYRCTKCQGALVLSKVEFNYMGHIFSHEVPVCPKCGKVLITEELAKGRMREVEEMLEDK